MDNRPPMTMGQIGAKYGVPQRHVRNVFTRGFLPEPGRVGAYRVVPVDQLPEVESALRRAGYLPAEAMLATA